MNRNLKKTIMRNSGTGSRGFVRVLIPRISFMTAIFACFILASCGRFHSPNRINGVEHVVIVGCDGMGGRWLAKAPVKPNMDWMMKNGAFTLHARGVMPTSSSPNWASMIMGAGPEQHGVTSNEWERDKFDIAPTVVGSGGIFPTIFGVLREQRPNAVIVCCHDWEGFGRLVEPKACHVLEHCLGPATTAHKAVAYFKENQAAFTFIHLDHVDHAGHDHGWGSPEYVAAVEEADRLIGEVIQGLRDAGMWDHSIVLVTADHGGKERKHGGLSMEEIEIPWIMVGRGVAAGREIKSPINTYDTAATVAHIFGLRPPECWIGRPVREAFDHPAARARQIQQ